MTTPTYIYAVRLQHGQPATLHRHPIREITEDTVCLQGRPGVAFTWLELYPLAHAAFSPEEAVEMAHKKAASLVKVHQTSLDRARRDLAEIDDLQSADIERTWTDEVSR